MADSKTKQREENKPRRVGPKHEVKLPTLRRIPMPHEELIRRQAISPVLNTGLTLDTGPLQEAGPVDTTGQSSQTGPTGNAPVALRSTGPSLNTGPIRNAVPESEFSLLSSLPDVKGYMVWFHQVTDYLDRQLTPFEQCLYKQLYRLSWGYDQPTCIIGFPKLSERTNMSETAARQAAKGLIKKGLVKKRAMVFGKGVEQGIEWEIYAPPALLKYKEETSRRAARNTGPELNIGPSVKTGPLLAAPIKEINTQKENTQTQTGVRVGSRFSLEECRRYANHLKQTGQGITNPGGYATKIFRSGEADAFVEAFLNPPMLLNVGKCPTCRGSNFVYLDANNPDRGVRPCKHEALLNQTK
jgi:hypothetical protein